MSLLLKRPIRIDGDVAFVTLTKGYQAVIDAADVPLVEGRNWHAIVKFRSDGSVRQVYAGARFSANGRKVILMHRIIAGTPHGLETDHIDCNGLNNRRCNLRHATTQQNAHNQRTPVTNTSGFKGVSWHPKTRKWRALILIDGRKQHLGLFRDIEVAAAAYAEASAKFRGEFGRTA